MHPLPFMIRDTNLSKIASLNVIDMYHQYVQFSTRASLGKLGLARKEKYVRANPNLRIITKALYFH